MASAWSLGSLVAYAKENADVYKSSLITGAATIELIKREGTVMTGVKTTEKINILDTTAPWQEGDGCGWSASGTDTITQRTVTVGNIKINKEWCMDNLIPYLNQVKMNRGSIANLDAIPAPLEAAILDRMLNKQRRDMEIAVWQGDTASGNTQLQHFDGFIKIIDAAGAAVYTNLNAPAGTITVAAAGTAVVGVGTTFTTDAPVGTRIYNASGVYVGTVSAVADNTHVTISAAVVAVTAAAYKTILAAGFAAASVSNINTRIDLLYAGIPIEVLNSNARLFVGEDYARTYQRYLTSANLFNYKAEGSWLEDGFTLPGTSLKIQPTPGLSGTYRQYVIDPANMIYATDLENEYEKFEMGYEEKEENVWLKARWRAGVQIAFPAEVTASF